MADRGLTRRRLLAWLLAGGGGGGALGLGWLRRLRERGEALDELAVLGFADALPAGAAAIGERYLSKLSERPDRGALARQLSGRLAADGRAGSPAGSADAAPVTAAVRADFAAGRIVLVDGWVLSHTAATLFAIKALAVGR